MQPKNKRLIIIANSDKELYTEDDRSHEVRGFIHCEYYMNKEELMRTSKLL